ncbi:MAG: hypothetical protein HQ581_08730 [Planctomycetes bacterium]|nr:hypothetical protein [Planctomycetota bacterium]
MALNQYDVVRILRFNRTQTPKCDAFNRRSPRIGDIATIVEIHTDPCIGYELECSQPETGVTEWLITFRPDEIELEQVDE